MTMSSLNSSQRRRFRRPITSGLAAVVAAVAVLAWEVEGGAGKSRRTMTKAEKRLLDEERQAFWLEMALIILCVIGPPLAYGVYTIARDESSPRLWKALKEKTKECLMGYLGSGDAGADGGGRRRSGHQD